MAEQHVSVTVYTDSGIFKGKLALSAEARLSDFINIPAPFLHLKGGQVNNAAGTPDNPNEMYINKKSIRMLTTAANDDARGAGAKGKMYPYVNKKQVRVKIHVSHYEISGNLHSFDEGSIHQLLQLQSQFLPCTDVNIIDLRNNTSSNADFAALNLHNISAILRIEN
jgi:hypothetical protein